MTTLLEYTRTEFPNHTVEIWRPDGSTESVLPGEQDAIRPSPTLQGEMPKRALDASENPRSTWRPERTRRHAHLRPEQNRTSSMALEAHTAVAHVVGREATLAVLERMHNAGWKRSAATFVNPIEPTIISHGQENSESAADLPDRRIVLTGALGALIGGAGAAALGWLVADHVSTTIVTGVFGAVLGAVIGAMLGGLGRFAGEQAWSQPHAPGRTIGVVFVFASDEEGLVEAVRELEATEPHLIRIVNAHGAWRAPMS